LPKGLFVVSVIITFLPPSDAAGVYVKEKGDADTDAGVNIPAPSELRVAPVAEPLNVFPVTVTGVVPQVLPVVLLSVRAGGLAQPQETENKDPDVVHPAGFLTDI
jgi:hypothetical protein